MNPRNKKLAIFLFIGVLASALAINLRLYTLRNNTPHEVEEKATLIVIQNIHKTITQQIEKEYPTRSNPEKREIAKQQFDEILHQEKEKVRATIAQVTQQIQRESPSQKNPFYLPEADSYYYYNLTENIQNTGSISPQIKGSKYFNALMNAPHGYWEPLNLHPYIGYIVYKIIHLFQPDISLMEGVSYTPLFISVFIIFAFLSCCYILNYGPWTSLLGALYLICIPVFLRRSMFGWYKNDPINIFFLFLIPAIVFYGLKYSDRRRVVLYSAAAVSLLLSLYSMFWQGWVFLASLIMVSGFFICLYSLFRARQRSLVVNQLIYFLAILGGSFIGVSLVFGPGEFLTLFTEGWVALQDFINPPLSLWPDLYLAVGELIAPTPEQWFEMMGGVFFIAIGVIGLAARAVALFIKPFETEKLASIFLIVFWLITVKLSFGAQRFETLALIPCALAFPLGLQFLLKTFTKLKEKFSPHLTFPRSAQYTLMFITIAVLSSFPFIAAQKKTPELLNKIFNSTWDEALTKIKNETPKDSIINTWWPPGHFIKAISQRRVTFDGATINKPQSYWIANALLATDERTAAGILRMLNDSGNDAVDELVTDGLTLSKAVALLKEIVSLSEPEARQILTKTLNKNQVERLLALTHTAPPPSYLLLYTDMAEESLQFSFVGNWDFTKIEKISNDPELRKNVPKRGSPDYVPFLWKLAGGPPRYTHLFLSIAEKGSTILFENNITVDRSSLTATINSPKYGKGIPRSIFMNIDGEFTEKKLLNATLPTSVILIKDGSNYKSMLTEPSLGRSMLFRLYYFGGKGLNIFEPFCDETDTTGRTHIIVYKINWKNL